MRRWEIWRKDTGHISGMDSRGIVHSLFIDEIGWLINLRQDDCLMLVHYQTQQGRGKNEKLKYTGPNQEEG